MVHQIINGLRLAVKSGDGRSNDGTHFGEGHHRAEMTKVKRSLANHQDKLSALFQHDIRRTSHQVRRDSVRDAGHGGDGAWRDNHCIGEKRSTCEPGCDVFMSIGKICKGFHVASEFSGFQIEGFFGRATEDQVSFYGALEAQFL